MYAISKYEISLEGIPIKTAALGGPGSLVKSHAMSGLATPNNQEKREQLATKTTSGLLPPS